jgi:type II secretory pathway pseudopilin PulG
MLEVLVVLGIISVLSAMLVPSSQENVSLERVIGNAKLLSQKLVELSVDARASGRMVRLDCNSTGIRATTYRNTRSRDYNSSHQAIGVSSNIISSNIPLIQINTSTRLVCPTSNPIYITSEGYIFSGSSIALAGITGLELRSGPYGARLLVSAAGVSTISAGVVGSPFNDL